MKRNILINCQFLVLIAIISCNNVEVKHLKKGKLYNSFSKDSIIAVVISKHFPNEGYDYEIKSEIPIYTDSIHNKWTSNKSIITKALDLIPPICDSMDIRNIKTPGCCNHESYGIHLIFPNLFFTIQQEYEKNKVHTNFGYYKLEDSIPFNRILAILDRQIIHKQKIEVDLTHKDSAELQKPYNKIFSRRIGNGYYNKDSSTTIWKRDWYSIK